MLINFNLCKWYLLRCASSATAQKKTDDAKPTTGNTQVAISELS